MVAKCFSPDPNRGIKFEFATDDELERFTQRWYHDRYLMPTNGQRRIAGSKRVERYKREHGQSAGNCSGQGPLLQSITAHPALSTRSFEELRVECYAQTFITQGKPPPPVDAVVTPGAVIPPLFNVYSDETDDISPNEITMAD